MLALPGRVSTISSIVVKRSVRDAFSRYRTHTRAEPCVRSSLMVPGAPGFRLRLTISGS